MKNDLLFLVKTTFVMLMGLTILSCSETGKQNSIKNPQDEWSKNNTREISADDIGLAHSKEKTKESLPYFVSEFKKGDGSFLVKAALSEDGQYEHIWLAVLKIEGGNSVGVLYNSSC
jgi:uncharacterized protein YegJ (DUF2314 family)